MKLIIGFVLTTLYVFIVFLAHKIYGSSLSLSLKLILTPISFIIPAFLGFKLKFADYNEFFNFNLRVSWSEILYGIIGIIGLFTFTTAISILISSISQSDINIEKYILKINPIESIVFSLLLIPVFEEVFFRKFLTKSLTDNYGIVKGVVFSSILFAYAHILTNTGLFQLFIGGLFFSFIFIKSNSILLNILLHVLFNLLMLLLYSDVNLWETRVILNYLYGINGWLSLFVGMFFLLISFSYFKKNTRDFF